MEEKKDHSELISYCIDHLIIAWPFLPAFLGLVFKSFPMMSRKWSYCIFFVILLLSMMIGYFIQRRFGLTFQGVICNYAVGCGIYSFIALYPLRKKTITVLLIVMTVLLVLYSLLLTAFLLRRRTAFREGLRRWLALFLRGGQVILSVGMLGFMLSICGRMFLGKGIQGPRSVKPEVVHETTIENSIDKLCMLRTQEWEKLTVEERLDVLQTIANIERHSLGVTYELQVGVNEERDRANGEYIDQFHCITVDSDQLLNGTPFKLVEIICHECYHAYEYSMIELYLTTPEAYRSLEVFEPVKQYIVEFNNYVDGSDDFERYYNQACEANARAYADKETDVYYYKIKNYLEKGGF